MALDDRLPGRHGDDDVGEVAPGGLAQAQPAQLDVGAERAIARSAASRASAGVRSISTFAFSAISRTAAAKMIAATTSAATESPWAKPAAHEQQSDEHRERARHVAGEVKGVGAQRGAGVAPGGAQRDDRAAEVDDERDRDHRELVPVGVGGRSAP